MILAAGFGTRLLPFTRFRPKPLFPIINRPLLLLTIERLKEAGFDHIVVNCHHLKEQIVDALNDIDGVVIQEEDMILGTGGGLRLALQYFRDEPVLVTNGDIYHTIDYREVYESHILKMVPITMVMHDYPRFNKVIIKNDRVAGFDGGERGFRLAFTGLQVVNPEYLEQIPLGQTWSIIDFYRQLIQKNISLWAKRVDGSFWTDMGTIEDYMALHEGLLTGKIPWWQVLGPEPETSFWIAEGNQVDITVKMQDWVCMGKTEVGRNVSLSRVVLWDGARISGGSQLQDAVVIK